MINLKLITRAIHLPYTSYRLHYPPINILNKSSFCYSSINPLTNITQSTNLEIIPTNIVKTPQKVSPNKQVVKNGNHNQIESIKWSEELKTILEGVLQRFNTHQIKLIKTLDQLSDKSLQQLTLAITKEGTCQFDKLNSVSNQSKSIKKSFVSAIQASTKECLESIDHYAKDEGEKKGGQSLKGRDGEKGKALVSKLFQKIKQEVKVVLAKEKGQIEKMIKMKGQLYVARARLNKQDDNQQWLDDKFLKVYQKDLKEIRNIVQHSGSQFFFKVNAIISRTEAEADTVQTKKKLSRTQSK